MFDNNCGHPIDIEEPQGSINAISEKQLIFTLFQLVLMLTWIKVNHLTLFPKRNEMDLEGHPTLNPIFFIFMQCLEVFWSNNRLRPPPPPLFEVGTPGKC